MSDTGGGAEARARLRQYDYRTNSSLVLTSDSRCRDTGEPAGDVQSLWGKIDPKSFGTRAYKAKPESSMKKKRERGPTFDAAPFQSKKRRLWEEGGVLASVDVGVYQPKTAKTRAAYETMLSVIQQQLGGQPLNVVTGAADEILAVLKNKIVKNHDKKKEIEKLLNPITSQTFDWLVGTGKEITDYHDGCANGDGALDDDVGVAIEFEENEEEWGGEESDLDIVHEDEEEEDDDVAKLDGFGTMQIGGIDDDVEEEALKGMSLNVLEIDAYWLQRKISQAYNQNIDPQQSQKLAELVLGILAEG